MKLMSQFRSIDGRIYEVYENPPVFDKGGVRISTGVQIIRVPEEDIEIEQSTIDIINKIKKSKGDQK